MGVTKSFKTWWNVCWGSQAAGANPQRTSHIILIQRRIDFKKTARDALEANWCEKHCRSTILRELAAFSVSRKFESLFSQFPSTPPLFSQVARDQEPFPSICGIHRKPARKVAAKDGMFVVEAQSEFVRLRRFWREKMLRLWLKIKRLQNDHTVSWMRDIYRAVKVSEPLPVC